MGIKDTIKLSALKLRLLNILNLVFEASSIGISFHIDATSPDMRVCAHLLALIYLVTNLATSEAASRDALPLPLRDIHHFPLLTYLQDIAVASNGDLYMTTVFPDATIYSVSDTTSSTPSASVVHKFEDINATTGIIETQPGIFNLLAGKQGAVGVGFHGTFGVFELDTRHGEPVITELVHLSNAGLIVGVIPTPSMPEVLLVSDSTLGKVWRVDTAARKYEEVLHDVSMEPPPWAALPFGIGGVQFHKGYLYFVVSFEALIYRIRFTEDGYPVPGADIELVVAVRSIYIDNFVIGPGDGDIIWAATNADNKLFAITPDGNVTVVAGAPDETTIEGDVAGAFGRVPGDTNTLYLVTSGGLVNPINGTVFEGGKVVALDTTGFLEDSNASDDHTIANSKIDADSQQPLSRQILSGTPNPVLDLLYAFLEYIVGQGF